MLERSDGVKVRIYKIANHELIGEYNVKSAYEERFYHRDMPTLSAKRCREILNTVCPHCKIESETFLFEDARNGHAGMQPIYRQGTKLNF